MATTARLVEREEDEHEGAERAAGRGQHRRRGAGRLEGKQCRYDSVQGSCVREGQKRARDGVANIMYG